MLILIFAIFLVVSAAYILLGLKDYKKKNLPSRNLKSSNHADQYIGNKRIIIQSSEDLGDMLQVYCTFRDGVIRSGDMLDISGTRIPIKELYGAKGHSLDEPCDEVNDGDEGAIVIDYLPEHLNASAELAKGKSVLVVS